MPFKKEKQPFIKVLSIILVVVVVLYAARIFSLQIINAKEYNTAAAGIVNRTSVIKASRGEILDSSGRKIAANRDGYDIVLNSAYLNKSQQNSIILELINLCNQHGCAYIDKLPLNITGGFQFTDDASAVAKLKKTLGLADYATPENCFDRLVTRYNLEQYNNETRRQIMGVRYSMEIAAFSIAAPYTFAEDISSSLMLVIAEAGYILNGVSVEITPYREYAVTDLAPHIIGSIGPIYEEEWQKYKEKGYSYNDKIGKSGIEAWAEEYLHGTDGEITYKVDSKGKILEKKVTKAPINGKTVVLTIDKTVQTVAQEVLKSTIKEMQSKGGSVTGGSVVVTDIKNGAILTSANYPSYDMSTMSKEYNNLLANPHKPLLDRAFQGVYPIGSTMKPIVAVAAMQNGKYNYGETIKCVRTYDYFDDYKPECMHYHGSINLKTALSKSCNYFFFEIGRRVGINSLNSYLKDFGLGVKTGVEVNDSAGILTEYKNDSGNTIQVAIGQLNAFTPLQLSNYTATLANGGTRYKATLINSVVAYDFKETYLTNQAQVVESVNISPEILAAVKEGMLSVTVDGTGSAVFADYPIKVGGKTGTSQTNSGADHSVFIAFAPFDNPEIAVSVVLEHGSSTFGVTSVAKAVLDSYFFPEEEKNVDIIPNTLLQ
ncbi:MAG: penicillin-binding protein [Clostridia bacterium]|nr:penicillin-binding protein [Clostridia bacterium]